MIKIIVAKLLRIASISAVNSVGLNANGGEGSTGIKIVSPAFGRLKRPLTTLVI